LHLGLKSGVFRYDAPVLFPARVPTFATPLFFLMLAGVAGCARKAPPSAATPATSTVESAAVDASVPARDAATTPPTAPAGPRFIGRFSPNPIGKTTTSTPEGGYRFAWSGSGIVARFRGTSIAVRLKDEGRNYFQIVLDGQPSGTVRVEAQKERYPLAEKLTDGIHEVAIYRKTEPRVGETAFLGFETDGELLAPPPPPPRRIELIGDSITAGYGNEGPNATCTFNSAEENEYLTYGALTARALHAEHVTLAWSAQTIGQMTDYFERTLPARNDSRWDFASAIPDVVVINLGTNNFATYDPGEERYVRIYRALFARVRAVYPKAFIVCALGPMLTDVYPPGKNNLTLARKYMAATMAQIEQSGEKNFQFVEFPEQNHANGLGCGFHPSKKTHQLMADQLVRVIHDRLGW
jgi:lysophospholipase L1-like esterase